MGLASRSSRKLTDQEEKIEEPAELAQVQWQARRVHIKSVLSAIALTLAVLVLPK